MNSAATSATAAVSGDALLNLSADVLNVQVAQRFSTVSRLIRHLFKLRRSMIVLCIEALLTILTFAVATILLSLVYGDPQRVWQRLLPTVPLLLLARSLSFVACGSCKLSLREASVPELICIVKAASLGSLLFYSFVRLLFPNIPMPAALLLLDWTLAVLLLAALHFGLRVYKAQRAIARRRSKRALIVGAGDAATSIVRDLVFDAESRVLPVGLVDDDQRKHGTTIYGVPVLGGLADLAVFTQEYHADEVLICIPSATRAQMKSILTHCRECDVPVRSLPSLADLVGGQPGKKDFRSLPIEDLLQREELTSDPAVVKEVVKGRVVLVTGAGGSIGSELCRHIAAGSPRKLVLLEKSENSLFYINLELHEKFPDLEVEPVLVDLTCRDRVQQIFRRERPDVVFHAAAHKHVHLLELHPHEAVRNNILGTRNVAMAAQELGTARFVNISTDKAVKPRNYMGLSKKMTELLIKELAQTSNTLYMNVRFGNVAGSTGSVLRLFRDQIQKGGPLRITDPRATRYFMTISEAVCLILHAAALGKGGETFVFDMGNPLNIYEIARTLTLFSGLTPGKDLRIEFVGLKEGEKVEEELWEPWETPQPTRHDRILALSGGRAVAGGVLGQIEVLETLVMKADYAGVLACLHQLFPEFAATKIKKEITCAAPAQIRTFSAETQAAVALCSQHGMREAAA